MSAKIIDGKAIATNVRQNVKAKIDELVAKDKNRPCLAVILVGEDPASQIYISHKTRACDEIGILSRSFNLASDTSQNELLALINELNADVSVHGILLQLPLPEHLDSSAILDKINPQKDVDGFHPFNLGHLAQRTPKLRPCTPKGIMQLLASTKQDLAGKEALVVGASNIVGRPMSLELLMAGCTVTTAHRLTQNLEAHVARADIIIAAAGVAELIKGDCIKNGAIIIDVGINRREDGRICGDVEFDAASKKASWISPVPGGVGPMTVACLMENSLEAYLLTHQF